MRNRNFECWECILGGPGVALTSPKWGRTELGQCNLPSVSIVTELGIFSRSCTCCAHWRTDGFCLSVTRPYKIAWMFPWNSLHTVQLLCVHTSKVSEQFAEIKRILWWLSFYGIWFWIFTSSKKKNMKHSLQLWQRIQGLIKDHYHVAFCQLLFESRELQIFYYLKYVV